MKQVPLFFVMCITYQRETIKFNSLDETDFWVLGWECQIDSNSQLATGGQNFILQERLTDSWVSWVTTCVTSAGVCHHSRSLCICLCLCIFICIFFCLSRLLKTAAQLSPDLDQTANMIPYPLRWFAPFHLRQKEPLRNYRWRALLTNMSYAMHSTQYEIKTCTTCFCVPFLSDPGVPGVRSLGPDVRHSYKTFLRLNWCDSGWWRYQLNTNQ